MSTAERGRNSGTGEAANGKHSTVVVFQSAACHPAEGVREVLAQYHCVLGQLLQIQMGDDRIESRNQLVGPYRLADLISRDKQGKR